MTDELRTKLREQLEQLCGERESAVRELKEIDAWLASAKGEPLTAHLKWKAYMNERAEKVARKLELDQRMPKLKNQILSTRQRLNFELANELYHGVCELAEVGIDIGSRLRAGLECFESLLEGVPNV